MKDSERLLVPRDADSYGKDPASRSLAQETERKNTRDREGKRERKTETDEH
jgi:hypothetical protein